MSISTQDTANIIAPPPVLFFSCLVGSYLLDLLVPWRVLDLYGWSRISISISLFTASGVIVLLAWRALKRHKTPADPSEPTTALVCEGPFRFSRNPFYISLLLLYLSLSTLVGSVWMLMCVVTLFLLLDYGVVRREEQYLLQRFGDQYRSYMKAVRRWI
jgi:protein-S-isoprenylcysteine O-methyltransferase Ste14